LTESTETAALNPSTNNAPHTAKPKNKLTVSQTATVSVVVVLLAIIAVIIVLCMLKRRSKAEYEAEEAEKLMNEDGVITPGYAEGEELDNPVFAEMVGDGQYNADDDFY
jgi:nitric oxide reductase large subunit